MDIPGPRDARFKDPEHTLNFVTLGPGEIFGVRRMLTGPEDFQMDFLYRYDMHIGVSMYLRVKAGDEEHQEHRIDGKMMELAWRGKDKRSEGDAEGSNSDAPIPPPGR